MLSVIYKAEYFMVLFDEKWMLFPLKGAALYKNSLDME